MANFSSINLFICKCTLKCTKLHALIFNIYLTLPIMEVEQNIEHYAATKDAKEAAKTEHTKEPNKEECKKSKRKMNKPQYLKDYAMK